MDYGNCVPVLRALFSLVDVPFWPYINANFNHTPWVGIHFWDTIFPLFIFIVGISLSFSIKRRLQRGESRARIYAHVIKRSLLLFLLGLFYYIIDVKGHRKWAFPFILIGLNPLTIYVAQELFDFGIIVNIFLHGVVDSLGPYRLLVVAACVLATKWFFLHFLYKKRIFLKV